MLDPDNLLLEMLSEPIDWELDTFEDRIQMWDDRPERIVTITFRPAKERDVVLQEPGDS